jgi:multiple sugar transport system permease protein/raffinose/stachyose/melibiose transport system permease protein
VTTGELTTDPVAPLAKTEATEHPRSGGRTTVTHRAARRGRGGGYRLWFALPSILLVGLFFGAPFLANAAFAFLRWTSYSTRIEWTGAGNFQQLLDLGVLWHAIRLTVLYAVISMAVQNGVGLLLATALRAGGRADRLLRAVYFVPVLFSPLAAGYIWAAAFQTNGPVNAFLSAILPGQTGYDWLGHSTSALVCVAVIDGWKWSGLATVVYIAGLNRIPAALGEAARLDGAGDWRRFWQVEFPLLMPSLTFNLVVTLAGSFSAIDVVFSMTGGGPGNATTVLNAELYSQYAGGMFGTASALGLVITLLVVATAVPLIAWLRRREVQM